MKYVLIIQAILAALFLGCSGKHAAVENTPILVGKIEREELQKAGIDWFGKKYEEYHSNPKLLEELKSSIGDAHIIVFMGTWCGDSKREIPRFYKIMDDIKFTRYTMYGLDRKKKSPEGKEAEYNIQKVPTFIVLIKGKELGRIIEIPEKSIEEDLIKILKTTEY